MFGAFPVIDKGAIYPIIYKLSPHELLSPFDRFLSMSEMPLLAYSLPVCWSVLDREY